MNLELLHRITRTGAAMENEESAMEKAQMAMDRANDALQKWKQENPDFSSENKWFLYYQKEVDWCYNTLQRRRAIYEKLIEKFDTDDSAAAKLKEAYNIAKRILDYIDEQSSNSESNRSSITINSAIQNIFRNKLISRDCKCLISGSDDFMTCHIIPHSFLLGNSGIWAQYYNPFCFDPYEGIFDVRNGILLSPSWYNHFRKYHFTIVYENEIYKIKTGNYSIEGENGKVLTFPTGKDTKGHEWKDQWPAPEFLKWHNDKFDQRQIKLKANIDRLWFKIQRADGATHFDENDYRIKWLNDLPSTTDYEDPEISIKAPEDSLEFMEQLQPL